MLSSEGLQNERAEGTCVMREAGGTGEVLPASSTPA